MKPGVSPWIAAFVAAVFGVGFAWVMRLPLPFDGFAAVAAAGLAFLGTLTLLAWMPTGWIWSEAEQLRQAFQARHGVSDYAAGSALEAITKAHTRATALRGAARTMREDVAERVSAVADRMDAAAREIFYSPDRQRDLRAVLIRSELIEDAAVAHAALRRRDHAETEDASRQKLISAVEALDVAFDQTDLLAARGLLAEVEAASEVAESVLKPRRIMNS
ncbi:MAG: hypothetical protein AAF222_11645 [Pseudomonadota bacterium]